MIASCLHCLWIFDDDDDDETQCPQCGKTEHDGARAIYGAAVYNKRKSQQPWFDRQMRLYAHKLKKEIKESE